MKTAAFIPIKQFSERVKGKNFKKIGGLELYKIIIEKVMLSEVFTTVYVDTDSQQIKEFAELSGAVHVERLPSLASNTANGNDLLCYHYDQYPDFDYYFQIFATAPLLKSASITSAAEILLNSADHDSIMTVLGHRGFFWRAGLPVSYRPDLLPRSQDLVPVFEETTALYGIKRDSLRRLRSRIGSSPIFFEVNKLEAIDLNTEEDFAFADWLIETERRSFHK